MNKLKQITLLGMLLASTSALPLPQIFNNLPSLEKFGRICGGIFAGGLTVKEMQKTYQLYFGQRSKFDRIKGTRVVIQPTWKNVGYGVVKSLAGLGFTTWLLKTGYQSN